MSDIFATFWCVVTFSDINMRMKKLDIKQNIATPIMKGNIEINLLSLDKYFIHHLSELRSTNTLYAVNEPRPYPRNLPYDPLGFISSSNKVEIQPSIAVI